MSEHLREKLTTGGTGKFRPEEVASTSQGAGVVTVTLTDGKSFTLKDEQLVGPSGPAGVIARINEAKAKLPKTAEQSRVATVPTLEQRVSKLENRITTLEQR